MVDKRRRKPEPHRENVEDLRRKGEWFRQGRSDSLDLDLGRLRERAISQADRLGTMDIGSIVQPGGRLDDAFKFIVAGKVSKAAREVDNPAPELSRNLAGPVIEVRSPPAPRKGAKDEGEDAPAAHHLRIRLDKSAVKRVLAQTIRVMRWEPETERWVLVPRSGAFVEDGVAWALIHRPGVYAPIGLPSDPASLSAFIQLMPYRGLFRDKRKIDQAVLIRGLLTGNPDVNRMLEEIGEPDLLPMPQGSEQGPILMPMLGAGPGGLPDLPGLPPLDLPGFGRLPEWDILDDICPPWRGRRILWPEPIPELIWPRPWWPPFPRDWVHAGPANFSGRIKSLAIHPTNGSRLYAGAADGGVWRTNNAGLSWHSLMTNELSMAVGSVAVARSDPNIIYAATGEDTPGWNPSYPGVGVYRSADAGNSWALTGGGVLGDRCSKIVVHPTDPNRVLVASNSGLYRTTDGGATWTRTLIVHVSDIVQDEADPDWVWAGAWLDGVYQSTDGGVTWTRSGLGTPIFFGGSLFWIGRLPTGASVEWIKLAFSGNTVMAKMGTNSGDIYRSRDRGRTYFRVATGVEPADYNEWCNMIAMHPTNANTVIAGAIGISRATNGTSFTGVGGTHSDHHQVVYDGANPNICWIATDGGVYRSSNAGASWTLRSQGLRAAQLYSIGVSQSILFLIGSGTQDQGIIAGEGTSQWRDTGAGNEGGFFIVDPNDSNNVYACPWSADLVRSTDRANSWTSIRSGMTDTSGGTTASVSHVAVRPGTGTELVASGTINTAGRVYRSTNRGNSWTRVLTPASPVIQLAYAPNDGSRVFAGTDQGRLYRSNSGGSSGSWTEPAAAPPGGTQAIRALAVDWNDRDRVWIGLGGYWGQRVRWSDDGGQTWNDATGLLPEDQLPAMPINALVIDQFNPDTVYVANDIGVFRTRDAGQSWENYNDGFLFFDVPRIIVTGLALRRRNNTLYAGTMGRGAYRRYLG